VNYALYDATTGEITAVVGGANADTAPDGMALLEAGDGIDETTHYVDPAKKKLVKRPAASVAVSATEVAADGHTPVRLSPIEGETVVEVEADGQIPVSATVTGDTDIVFDYPATYTITVMPPFPGAGKKITVHGD
jgi:hypothetical protein